MILCSFTPICTQSIYDLVISIGILIFLSTVFYLKLCLYFMNKHLLLLYHHLNNKPPTPLLSPNISGRFSCLITPFSVVAPSTIPAINLHLMFSSHLFQLASGKGEDWILFDFQTRLYFMLTQPICMKFICIEPVSVLLLFQNECVEWQPPCVYRAKD